MIDGRLAKRALMGWGVGRRYLPTEGDGAAVVLVEDAGHVGEALASGVLAAGGVLLAPADADVPDQVQFLPFHGDPSEPASELTVGDDVFVGIQDYATAEYMSVIGPTLLRMLDAADFPAFVADLDRAVDSGRFADYLTHPASQLADRSALGGPTAVDGPGTRLHLRSDATWSTAPLGADLGRLGDSWGVLHQAWQAHEDAGTAASVALARAVPEAERSAALSARPWASHAISAVGALQDLAARKVLDVRVSGYGGRLNPALSQWSRVSDAPTVADSGDAPVLAWTDSAAFLHLPGAGRTFQVDVDAAGAVEAVLVTGSAVAAEELADRRLVHAAADMLAQNGVVLAPERVG